MELITIFQTRINVLQYVLSQGRDFLTFKEAAKVTGLGEASLRVYAGSGKLSVLKHGRRAYLRLEEVTKLVKN